MGKKIPKGKTNEEAYATYRRFVEPELRDVATIQHRRQRIGMVGGDRFVTMAAGFWTSRYYRRMEALDRWKIDKLDPVLADTEAKDILLARHRAHNAAYGIPKEFTDEQVAVCNSSTILNMVDISSLSEIPSYGPSLISLWTDAKAMGLPDEEAAERILDWAYHTPPAWARDDERKKKKLPKIDKAVQARLNQLVTWQRTGDLFIPWNSQVEGQTWEARINDFPDEYMYSLSIDGTLAGDFHEWPEAWDRGAGRVEAAAPAKPAVAPVSIDATRLVARYEAGECEAVWRDLLALGADVRKPAYAAAADSVVRETMRRVRRNFETIVARLKSIDYQFYGGVWEAPELREDPKLIASCEHEGLFLPLSLKAFVEQFGAISLLGSHPLLAPEGIETDPLMIGGPQLLEGTLEHWAETEPEDRTSISYAVCPDAESKLDMLDGDLPTVLLRVQLPDESADVVLDGEPRAGR